MKAHTPAALEFKSATLYTLRIVLHSDNTEALLAALAQKMHDAGSFFENEAVVIDASNITSSIDWRSLIDALRKDGLHPVGVVASGTPLHEAHQLGLEPVDVSAPVARTPSAPVSDVEIASVASSPPQAPTVAPAALVIQRPLRSGQRVYARDTDIIVIGMVSQGAEVIADGNVHVYGPLRGKAMAGARGDTSARIFTTQLDPELIAIAGVYQVIETPLEAALHNQATMIVREGDRLQIEALGK